MYRALTVDTSPLGKVLKKGEAGFFGGAFKVGDGVNAWQNLTSIAFKSGANIVQGVQWFEYRETTLMLKVNQGQIAGQHGIVQHDFINPYELTIKTDVEYAMVEPRQNYGGGYFLDLTFTSVGTAVNTKHQFKVEYYPICIKRDKWWDSDQIAAPYDLTLKLTVRQVCYS
jgi:hypothetical protein